MASEGSNKKKRIVVVGGGIAGSFLAKSVQFFADVSLIDPKEYLEIPWAKLRCMVEPSFAEKTLIKHSDYLTKGKIFTSSAVKVTETEVWTANGLQIGYDYLVLATGHSESVPKSREERLKQFQDDCQKIKSSNSVLIVGGGPTGVELAGELAVDFPEKKVTLVHKGSRLLEFIGSSASHKTLNWLTSRKVDILLNQAVNLNVESDSSNSYTTSRGETVNADCHFLCIGSPLGSSWMKESIFSESVDEKGRLMVDKNLRVRGWKNIFAIGDITDLPELKQGFYALKHAEVVAKNLKLLMEGGNESKMGTYKAGSDLAMVSLGRKDAVAQFPFLTLIGFLPGMIKSKNLFVGKTRKQLGLDP